MHKAEVAELLALLVGAFPRTQITERTLDAYTLALADCEPEAVIAAVSWFMLRGKGFPLVQELRDMIASHNGDGVPEADQAWAEVMRAVSRFGSYREPSFSHPAITAAVDSLTWREICLSENAPALRAHFAEAYEAAKKRAMDPAHTALAAKLTAQVAERMTAQRPALTGSQARQLEGAKP